MPFPSVELATRIERSESRLIVSSVAQIRFRLGRESEGFCLPIGDGHAAFTSLGSPLNKVVGVGFAGIPDESTWAEVERQYSERGCPVQVELSNLADPSIGEMLTRRGYRLVNHENVLGIDLVEVGDMAVGDRSTEMEACDASRLSEWLDVIVTGFASPDDVGVASHEHFERADLERVLTDMVAAPGFQLFLARRDGQLAGAASMFLGDGVAHLCGAATLPAHRRRGVQTALLQFRLVQARTRGLDLAVMTTQPGSKSQQNARRRGFELLYARSVLVLECKATRGG